MSDYVEAQLKALEIAYADRGATVPIYTVEIQAQHFVNGFPEARQRVIELRTKYAMVDPANNIGVGEEIDFAKMANDPTYNPLKEVKEKRKREAEKNAPKVEKVEVGEGIDLKAAFDATSPEELKSAFGNDSEAIKDFINKNVGTDIKTKKIILIWEAFQENKDKLKEAAKI